MALTAERVRRLFKYNKTTGLLVWRVNKARAKAGDVAGHSNGGENANRLRVGIDGAHYMVSRIIWLYVTGAWPKFEVDHIDTDSRNNRWRNLRDVPHRVNQENQREARTDSALRLLGVGYRRGKFRARITVKGKQTFLGSFDSAEAAHAAYLRAKRKLHKGNTL